MHWGAMRHYAGQGAICFRCRCVARMSFFSACTGVLLCVLCTLGLQDYLVPASWLWLAILPKTKRHLPVPIPSFAYAFLYSINYCSTYLTHPFQFISIPTESISFTLKFRSFITNTYTYSFPTCPFVIRSYVFVFVPMPSLTPPFLLSLFRFSVG